MPSIGPLSPRRSTTPSTVSSVLQRRRPMRHTGRSACAARTACAASAFAVEADHLMRSGGKTPTGEQLASADSARRNRSAELNAALQELKVAIAPKEVAPDRALSFISQHQSRRCPYGAECGGGSGDVRKHKGAEGDQNDRTTGAVGYGTASICSSEEVPEPSPDNDAGGNADDDSHDGVDRRLPRDGRSNLSSARSRSTSTARIRVVAVARTRPASAPRAIAAPEARPETNRAGVTPMVR